MVSHCVVMTVDLATNIIHYLSQAYMVKWKYVTDNEPVYDVQFVTIFTCVMW